MTPETVHWPPHAEAHICMHMYIHTHMHTRLRIYFSGRMLPSVNETVSSIPSAKGEGIYKERGSDGFHVERTHGMD